MRSAGGGSPPVRKRRGIFLTPNEMDATMGAHPGGEMAWTWGGPMGLGVELPPPGWCPNLPMEDDRTVCGMRAVISKINGWLYAWLWEETASPRLRRCTGFVHTRAFAMICLLVGLLCVACHVFFAFSPAVWLDPAVTLCIIDDSYAGMIAYTAADVHPPLYYVIVKFMSDLLRMFFPDLPVVTAGKLVSVVPFVLAVLLCMTTVRKTWGWYAAGLSVLAVTCVPHLIKHGTELRMYAWAMLFVFCCYLYAFKALQTAALRYWALFALSGLCAAYTHTYACLSVIPVYLYAGYRSLGTAKRQLWLWVAASAVAVLGFMPWLWVLWNQFQRFSADSWIPPMTLDKAAVFYVMPFLPKEVFTDTPNVFPFLKLAGWCFAGMTAFMGVAFLSAVLNRKKLRDVSLGYSCCGVSLYVFATAVGVVVSYVAAPVILLRYTTPAFCCMWMGLILLGGTKRRHAYQVVLAAIMLVYAVSDMFFYAERRREEQRQAESLIACVGDGESAAVVTDFIDIALPCRIMLEKDTYTYRSRIPDGWLKELCERRNRVSHLEAPDDLKKAIRSHEATFLLLFDKKLVKEMEQDGIQPEYQGSFHCFLIDFDLYKLELRP